MMLNRHNLFMCMNGNYMQCHCNYGAHIMFHTNNGYSHRIQSHFSLLSFIQCCQRIRESTIVETISFKNRRVLGFKCWRQQRVTNEFYFLLVLSLMFIYLIGTYEIMTIICIRQWHLQIFSRCFADGVRCVAIDVTHFMDLLH